MPTQLKEADLTDKIIKAFYHVYNTLGYGFLEKVYENALAISLRSSGILVEQQKSIIVLFDGQIVGEYFADLVAGGRVIVEIKCADAIADGHEAQLLNYLKATNVEVGLVLNFGPQPEFRRKVFSKKP